MQHINIRMLSGQEVASIPVGELTDVRELKLQLHQHHGFPTRFRQRLLLGGNIMDDSVELNAPMDLELVVHAYSAISPAQADELVAAAQKGSASEVETLLQLPRNPDLANTWGSRPLIEASVRGHIEVVQLLLDAAADTNVSGRYGPKHSFCTRQR